MNDLSTNLKQSPSKDENNRDQYTVSDKTPKLSALISSYRQRKLNLPSSDSQIQDFESLNQSIS